MAGVNEYLDAILPQTAAGQARKAAAAKAVEEQPAAAPAPAQQAGPAAHEFDGLHEVVDSGSGTKLTEDVDGGIWLRGVGGKLEKFAPHEAGKLLGDQLSGYFPATVQEAQAKQKQQEWDSASFAAKSDYVARQTLVGIADGVTAVPRLGAKLLGASPKVDEELSGENLVRKLDTLIAGEDTAAKESAGARALTGANPALDTAIDVGGMVLGGELGVAGAGALGRVAKVGAEAVGMNARAAAGLARAAEATSLEGFGKVAGSGAAKLAESLGLDAAKAAKLGSYADSVAQGAALGGTQAAHEAWIKDEPLTAEAQWNSIGLGAILGLGGHVAIDAVRGLPRAGLSAAEKVFGKARPAAEMTAATDASAQELSESLTGVKQPEGFGEKVKNTVDWMRNKVQELQAERTGAKLEDVKEFGALSPKHEEAMRLYENRDKIFDQGTKDVVESLSELHSEGSRIAQEVTDVSMKREHMARLLADVDSKPVMRLAKDKAAELQDAYENLIKVDGNGRTLLGGGKQVADIKAAYEDAYDGLVRAKAPEEVASALDVFKRATQRAKVNAEKTAERVTSGIERNQAFARADLMQQVSEKTRQLLEDESIFGKFGTAQREVNSRWNRVLDTDKYIRGQLFENTGQVSRGADYGATRWELSPARVESYLNGLGTNRAARVDQFLRDNIAARKELATTLKQFYELGEHEATVANVSAAADKSLATLKHLDETLRVTNAVDDMLSKEASAKGHGKAGATLAAMAGHMFAGPLGAGAALIGKAVSHVLDNPVSMTKQALALRDATQKLQSGISKSVGRALESSPAASGEAGKVARALATRETQERYRRRYATTAARVSELAANPAAAVDSIGAASAHIEHAGVQQAIAMTGMNALGFLSSKLPKPLYQNSVASGSQLNNISATERDKFMRYAESANKPADFFKALSDGTATLEQAETARTLMPQAFQYAQQEAMLKFASGKVTASYQVRLNVQRMLGIQVEPTANPALQSFIQQMAQQAPAQQQAPAPKRSSGKSTMASSMASPLSNLKV